MRIGAIRVPCRDLAEAERFYSDKLGLQRIFGSIADGYIGYALDNARLLLESHEEGDFEAGRYLGFSLVAEDIDAFYEAARARGVSFTGPPQKQSWGGVMTHVTDCSGNVFSIVNG